MTGCFTLSAYHGGIGCKACHETDRKGSAEKKLLNSDNPSQLCIKCHKYEKEEDHHPLSLISGPTGDTAEVNEPFKLYGESMTCLTCHEMHKEGHYSMDSPNYLVGGPYEERREICFKCHSDDTYKKTNPHDIMIDRGGNVNPGACLICHDHIPDPAVDRTEDVTFRASVAFLCWRCHQMKEMGFLDKHYLMKPQKETFITMRMSERDNDLIMPLDYMDRVTCSTCHNPHQKGVVSYEKTKKGAGEKYRLRDKELCSHCHSTRK